MDPRLLSKVAGLQQKMGDNIEAAETFTRLALVYKRDGFILKAAAVLKQALKLAPVLLEAREELAVMCEALSLSSDAVIAYGELLRTSRLHGDRARAARALEALLRLGAPEERN
jgi:pilus assembly protein FimV